MAKKFGRILLPVVLLMSAVAVFSSCSGGSAPVSPSESDNAANQTSENASSDSETEVQVFIAASLENAFQEIIPLYNESNPNVKITYNADSSGTLLTQIQEGYACDIFFSAATAQVDTLESENLAIEGTRVDMLANKVCLITAKNSGTKVTGMANLKDAENMALADGSVPVGKYTRKALMELGYIEKTEDAASITTQQISDALGIEINECGNVSKVKEAVKEGANEVGTVYYSDAYSVKDDVDIIEELDTSVTGDIIYPMIRVQNKEATDEVTAAADDFYAFLQTDEVKAIFEKYMFIVNK